MLGFKSASKFCHLVWVALTTILLVFCSAGQTSASWMTSHYSNVYIVSAEQVPMRTMSLACVEVALLDVVLSVPPLERIGCTCTAPTRNGSAISDSQHEIVSLKGMSVFAHGFLGIERNRCNGVLQHISAVRNRTKVIWIHTVLYSAYVVDFLRRWNGAPAELVRNAVCKVDLSRDIKAPVSFCGRTSRPQPASTGFGYVFPESRLLKTLFHKCTPGKVYINETGMSIACVGGVPSRN